MRNLTRLSLFAIAAAATLSRPLASAPAPKVPSFQQYLSPASPQEVVAAKKVDRVAWVDYAEGKRNAFTAAAPLFTPVRLTNFMKDDGIMMSAVKISDDGSTVIFLRGEAPNRDGWSPNPSADPNGPEHAIWAARTSGTGGAWRVVDATNPELAPDAVANILARFELTKLERRRWSTLSGGESARVLLAMVLVADPSILLADEPAAALDIRHRLDVIAALAERGRERLSVVVVHDLDLAFRYFERVVVLVGGKIAADAPAADLIADRRLDEAFGVRFERIRTAGGWSLQASKETT